MSAKAICVIEDNIPIRKLYSTILKKGGFVVNEFGDGMSAINWLKNNKTDAIIMDILLPDINGVELLKKVKEIDIHKNVKVCAITGFAQDNDKEKFLNEGFDFCLAKPINTGTFLDDVKSMFNL